MATVKILQNVFRGGHPLHKVGDVKDLDGDELKSATRRGWAEKHEAKAAAPAGVKSEKSGDKK